MTAILKKIASAIITIVVVSCLVFIAFSIIPGDPAVAKLGTQATPEKLEALRIKMGLNEPLLKRFVIWLSGIVRGDFSTSYSYSMSVNSLIAEKIPVTLILAIYSLIIMIIISIPVAVFAARHKGDIIERTVTIINQVIMSVPPFFGGILISLIFGMTLKLFTPGAYVSYSKNLGGFLAYMFFPALALALPKAAMAVSLLYTSIVDEVKKDYVRTAYSRGNSTKGVFYHHILKNACIPVITFLGMAIADMIAGSIVIEQVFSIPGLGRILLTSIQNRDYPVVEAIIVIIAALVILSNLLVDILYRIIDPRVGRSDE